MTTGMEPADYMDVLGSPRDGTLQKNKGNTERFRDK